MQKMLAQNCTNSPANHQTIVQIVYLFPDYVITANCQPLKYAFYGMVMADCFGAGRTGAQLFG
jgi:hypothetical protein